MLGCWLVEPGHQSGKVLWILPLRPSKELENVEAYDRDFDDGQAIMMILPLLQILVFLCNFRYL